jgi:hypothetical protein
MSAACALAEIANIATANRTLRIDHSHPHFLTWRDHRPLTLINRFQARLIGKILSENRQPFLEDHAARKAKRRGRHPAPLREVNSGSISPW